MTQAQNADEQQNNHNNYLNFIINPFQRKYRTEDQQFMMEEYIRNWIESIFYSNRKVDLQAKIDIYYRMQHDKAFQHTSCSTTYSMIRDTVQIVTWKLRDALDHSFDILKSSSKWLYKLSQTSSSWEINWMQFKYEGDPDTFKNIYPPISNMYITYYKYLCDCAKQLYALWKTFYEHIPVKDLNCQSFQQSINQLILDVFTTGSSSFRPKHMLPVISLANKCRFVNVDKEGTLKRMNLTKFKEDQLAINLAKASAKKFKKLGFNPEDALKIHQQEDKKSPFKNRENRESSRLTARSRVDTNLIEEIRNQYLDSYKMTTKMQQRIDRYRNVFQKLTAEEPSNYYWQSNGAQITGGYFPEVDNSNMPQLSSVDYYWQSNGCQITGGYYPEAQNSSQSQEDDLNDLQCDEKDELIEEANQIEVEHLAMYEKYKESEALAKLSSSTGIEENADQNDIILLKNSDLENPADFILQEQFSSMDTLEMQEKEARQSLQISKNNLIKTNSRLTKQLMLAEKHGIVSHHTVDKCRKRISKLHEKPRQHSKCCLEQEKQKLEQYRKQLQKEKQQLLRQVERFMKQKDKDNNLYRMAANHFVSKCSRKHGKNCIKYTQQIKQVDISRYRATFKTHAEPEISAWARQEIQKKGSNIFDNFKEQIDQSFCDEHSTGEATSNSQESWIDEIKQDKKMSKRQQKLRKKIEREMKELKIGQLQTTKSSKTPKEAISEEEAQLSNFLEQLNIGKSNRMACHIEEDRLNRWKSKIHVIRNKALGECPLKDSSETKQQSKKKKKNKQHK